MNAARVPLEDVEEALQRPPGIDELKWLPRTCVLGDGNGRGKWQPVEYFADSLPGAVNYNNSVTVIRY